MRKEFPSKVRVAAFQRANGHCEQCTAPLYPGKFAYDHVLPDALGGEPTLDNCQVLCSACHALKTGGEDVPRIRKADRQRKTQIDAAPAPARKIESAGFRKVRRPSRIGLAKVDKSALPVLPRRGISEAKP